MNYSLYKERYNLNVIGESDIEFLIEKDGYIYRCAKGSVSKFTFGIQSMISSSYLKYLNDNIFKETLLEAIELEGTKIVVLNKETAQFCRVQKYSPNIETILNLTTKKSKYLQKIKDSLGNFYTYEKCNPISSRDKVIITCPIHGDFEVSVSNAVHNHSGCPECALEYKGYSRHIFKKQCSKNNGIGKLYIVKLKSEIEGEFLKVGITSHKNINTRLIQIPRIYSIEVIDVFEGDASKIYNLEKLIHKQFRPIRKMPLVYFNGRTECYPAEIYENISEFIGNKLK
jgi:hypothetical protein|nr:MAG TPA: Protein of unknown function (DUF723) [Crassvirales sp.]